MSFGSLFKNSEQANILLPLEDLVCNKKRIISCNSPLCRGADA